MQDKSVVFGERKRIGGELVQCRISETQWRLHITPLLLLAEDVGDVIGAKSSCGVRLGESGGYGFGSVFPNQRK